ncbi:MAG: SDR family NAD(P)-dependent oxidoreductase, partial [Clostridia bacterium]|nr:SDR family NAD(P)-dependent oxidoreductase [Clostridia bacterium]
DPVKEKKTALVTGADRGLGLSVAKGLLRDGWRVFAGKYLAEYDLLERLAEENGDLFILPLDVSDPESIRAAAETVEKEAGKLDLLFSNAALMGGNGRAEIGGENPVDTEALLLSFRTNSLAGPLLVDALLPLLEKGEGKRLFFVSSEISSVRLQRRTGDMRYAMSKTALNMGVRLLFNSLRPRGYTFRLYQPGWMKRVLPDGSRAAGAMIDPDVSAEEALRQIREDRIDEDRLVLVDYLGRELSF